MREQLEQIKKDSRRWITDQKEQFTNIADKIWNYAEIALIEFKSSNLLADTLEEEGFDVTRAVAGMPTAFVATYGSGNPSIGILGEFDALPGLSQKAVPHKEPIEEGAPGHGCGHNLYGTAGVSAAIAVKTMIEKYDLPGKITFFACPAEERLVGKVFMVQAGLFDNVDSVITWHPGQANTTRLASSLALNNVKFRFHGVSSHAAASPEAGRSALDAVELMNIGVNYLREHIIEEARIHYVITKGGGAPNVVPDLAEVHYFIRAPKREQVEDIYERIKKIVKGAALMTGTEEEIDFQNACWQYFPNETLSDVLYKNIKEVGPPAFNEKEKAFAKTIAETFPEGQVERTIESSAVPDPERARELDYPLVDYVAPPADEGEVMSGSTDVADVSVAVPTARCSTTSFVLGAAGHSWQNVATAGMSIGHKGMITAAKALSSTALELLLNPDIVAEAKQEHEEKAIEYESPMPEGTKPPLPKQAEEKLKEREGE